MGWLFLQLSQYLDSIQRNVMGERTLNVLVVMFIDIAANNFTAEEASHCPIMACLFNHRNCCDESSRKKLQLYVCSSFLPTCVSL